MFCIKCGSNVSSEADFCQKCGYALKDDDATVVAARPQIASNKPAPFSSEHPEEQRIFSIRPTALFINIGYGAAILTGIALVVLMSLLIPIAVPWWVSVIVGLSPLLIPAYYHVMRNMVLYTLTDSKIEIDHGFISRTTRNVPLGKIQDVTVSRSVMQRLMGFGNLVIENAGETGGEIVLKNISSPQHYADLLLKQLRKFHKGDV